MWWIATLATPASVSFFNLRSDPQDPREANKVFAMASAFFSPTRALVLLYLGAACLVV